MEYHVIISGMIGSWWSGCSPDYVRFVLSQHKDEEVHVGFCSLGGYVKDGLELNQAFKDHGNVHAHAFGMNASISTIAMLGCKAIDIVKGSFFLIHNTSMLIDKWDSLNKEAIDDYIKELKATREDLATFDDVLADMYSAKTGKSREDVLAQMKKGNWMSAVQALDFGLVDSIREDDATQRKATDYMNLFNSSYSLFKESGIPPLPSAEGNNVPSIADGDGNPTPDFLRKTWQGLRSFFSAKNQATEESEMNEEPKVVFVAIGNLDGLPVELDGSVTLTGEQVTALTAHIADLNGRAEKAETNASESATRLETANKRVTELEEQVKNLSAAPGAQNVEVKEEAAKFTTADLFNSIKDV